MAKDWRVVAYAGAKLRQGFSPRKVEKKGIYIDPLVSLQRMKNNSRPVPEKGRSNPSLGFDFVFQAPDPVDPETMRGSTFKGCYDDGAWFRFEVYHKWSGGGVLPKPRLKGSEDLDSDCLLSMRIRLKLVRPYDLLGRNPTPSEAKRLNTQWMVTEVESPRPASLDSDVRVWVPVKFYTFPSRNKFIWKPRRICTLAYREAFFQQIEKVYGLGIQADDFSFISDLQAHLYADRYDLGTSPPSKAGQVIATLVRNKTIGEARIDLTYAFKARNPKTKTKIILKKAKKKGEYPGRIKVIGSSPYQFGMRPSKTVIRRGAEVLFTAYNTDELTSFKAIPVGKQDEIVFQLRNGEGSLLKTLKTQHGFLNQYNEKVARVRRRKVENADYFYRWARHKFTGSGDYFIACAVREHGKKEWEAAVFDLDVERTSDLLRQKVEKGLADKRLHDPWQAADEAEKVWKALRALEPDLGNQSKKTKDVLEYYNALLLLLYKGVEGVKGTDQLKKVQANRVMCVVSMAPLDDKHAEVRELRLCLVDTSSIDGVSKARRAFRIIDWTNPMHGKVYKGDPDDVAHIAIHNALQVWVDQSNYPECDFQVHIAAPYLISQPWSKRKNLAEKIADVLGWIAAGLGVLALILGLMTPFAPVVAPFAAAAIWGSLAAGTVGTALKLYDRHVLKKGSEVGQEDLFDCLELVANMFTAGTLSWAKGATVAARIAKGGKKFKFVFYGEILTDGFQGILLLQDSVKDMDDLIDNKQGLSPADRLQKLLMILSRVGMAYINFRAIKSDLEDVGLDPKKVSKDLEKLGDETEFFDVKDLPKSKVKNKKNKGGKKKGKGQKKKKGEAPKGDGKSKGAKKKKKEGERGEKVEIDTKPPGKVKRTPEIKIDPATKPKKLLKPPYHGPKKYKDAVTEPAVKAGEAEQPSALRSCEAGSCENGSPALGEAIFAKHHQEGVVPDVVNSARDGVLGEHKYVVIRGEDPPLILDGSLYQFFDIKFHKGGKPKDLLLFEGTPDELKSYLDFLTRPGEYHELAGAKFRSLGIKSSIKGRLELDAAVAAKRRGGDSNNPTDEDYLEALIEAYYNKPKVPPPTKPDPPHKNGDTLGWRGTEDGPRASYDHVQPVGPKSLIVDTNVGIALRKRARSDPDFDDGHKASGRRFDELASDDDVRLSKTAEEELDVKNDAKGTRNPKWRELALDVPRSSPEYQKAKAILKDFDVGGKKMPKALKDQAIVADAFYAKLEPGVDMPRLLTADKGIFNALGRMAKIKQGGKSLRDLKPDGFEVTLPGTTRKILVIPTPKN